ncbi:MAG: Flp/Fap pilin component [Chloroflexi bacterium]|nr:Flp/Fap pilin component [Chloroflexota bacterium]
MGMYIFQWFQGFVYQLRTDESGQDLTEYGLLVAFIAIVVVVAIVIFGEEVSALFGGLGASIEEWLS